MPSVKYLSGSPVTDADPLQTQDMAMAGTISAIGATTDAPFVGAETATARTAISLLKGIKNYVRDSLTQIVLAAGTAVIGGVNPPTLEKLLNPFGKGLLTTDGVQYGVEKTTSTDDYETVDSVVITQPTGYTLEQIEFGLTMAIKSSGAAESVLWKWDGSDAGVSFTDLIAEQTRAASAAAYADVTISGRWLPTGNFLGTGAAFTLRARIKSGAAAGETASGKVKNSSYILCKYRRA